MLHSSKRSTQIEEIWNITKFGGKRHLYGLETQMSVFRNRIATGISDMSPVSVLGVCLFRKRASWHRFATERDEDSSRTDHVELRNKYSDI